MNKSLKNKFLVALAVVFCIWPLPAFAAVGTFRASGEYTMSDYDNPDTSELRALDYARQSAAEQAGVYVEGYTRSQNMQVSHDEIMAMSSSRIKVTDQKITRTVLSTGDIRIHADITATVDTADIETMLQDKAEERRQRVSQYESLKRDKEKLEQDTKALQAKIDELNKLGVTNDFDAPDAKEREKRIFLAQQILSTDPQAAILLNPKFDDGYVRLASHYVDDISGLPKRDWVTVTKAIILNPDNYDAYIARYFCYDHIHSVTERQKALNDINEAIRINPNSGEAYCFRGGLYDSNYNRENMKNPDAIKAMNDFTHAIQLFTATVSDPLYLRGALLGIRFTLTHVDENQYDMALKGCHKIIELLPNNYEAYLLRADCYEKMKDYGNAISDYNKAIKLGVNQAESYSDRGHCYAWMKDYANAIKDCSKAIELAPNVGLYYSSRADIYHTYMRDYVNAIKDYTKAIELEQNDISSHFRRADCYKKIGDYANAIKDYTKLIELRQNFSWDYSGRADCYKEIGEYKLALQDYEKACSLNPSNQYSIKYRDEMKKKLNM